jgi:hypothetical protein
MDMHDRDGGVFAPVDEVDPYELEDQAAPTYARDDYTSYDFQPVNDAAISGAELRRRLITPEALAAMEADVPRPSLLERLIGSLRKRLRRR